VTVRIIILLFASTLAAFPASAQQRQQPTTYGPNNITVDFAKNRKASEVTSYPIGESAMIKADTDPRSPATPDSVVLTKIINREFPGFGFQVSQ
jgi:hypothetical protein